MIKRLLGPAVLLSILAGCVSPTPTVTPTATPLPTATPAPPTPAAEYTPTPEPEVDAPAWFDGTILYEVFVRSFQDSDSDGIGDLAGVTEKLDHIQSLHAGAIWLMPIHPSPSYHGYDVTDYFAVNPDYGSLDDMIALVEAAHQRGMHVIMDLVVNHMADEHPIFQDAYANPSSQYADWFLWLNDEHTSYRAFGGFRDMPELNYDNPAVLSYVLDIVRFWMDLDGDGDLADGVDGFRCDVAKDVPLTAWQMVRVEMRSHNPESLLLGEVWERNAQDLTRWYAAAFDALFDFPLYHELASDHDTNLDSVLAGVRAPDLLNAVILGEERLLPAGYEVVRMINNHDTNRAMSDVGGDQARAKLGAMLLLTLPGTPMIYYGEEIGMQGNKGGGPSYDEYRREPMDWYAAESGPGMTSWFQPGDRANRPDDGVSVQEEENDPTSLLAVYRALTTLRQAQPALRTGAFGKVVVSGSSEVYAFTRHLPPSGYQPESWFLMALNFSGEAQTATLELTLPYAGPFTAVDALSGEAYPDLPAAGSYTLELPPTSGVILELNLP